jgi:stage III sporulation protein AE
MGGGTVSGVAKNIKGLFNWILGIGTTVLLAAVSMQSIIAGAQDTAYLRAAKYAASGMIPLVGSTVSGALGTLAGGLSYVKSAVGVSAVMMIVTLALAPLVTLLLYRLAFSLSISFLEFMDAKGGVRSFSAFRSALDALIAVYSLSAVVYVSEIVVFMKSGVSVFG